VCLSEIVARSVQAFESVSTWQQPVPPPASAARDAVMGTVARRIAQLSPGRLRVAVDGLTGAGKTSFGHELAAALRGLGRPTMRASLDDFKHPRRHAREHGYDRVSGGRGWLRWPPTGVAGPARLPGRADPHISVSSAISGILSGRDVSRDGWTALHWWGQAGSSVR
jgi:hypothetical protein